MSGEIMISGWIDYDDPAHRANVLALFGDVARRSREEPGCLDYSVTADLDDERRIRVFEHWESAETLRDHLATPHVLEFRQAVAGFPKSSSLWRHVVTSSEPMSSGSA